VAVLPHLAIVLLLLGLSVAMFWHVWGVGHPSMTVLCPCGDPGQAVWFLAWVPWAVTHGHNPLFTNEIFAGQGGANLLESTSYLLAAFVMAPLTWLAGPTVSFNVIETLAPVLSGWCFFLAARRVTPSWTAAAAGSLLWGFSPFALSSLDFGHINFGLLFFPPLAFLICFELVGSDRHRPALLGLGLGLLLVAQFFAGTEPLAISAVTGLVAMVMAGLLAPKTAWRRRRRLGIGLGIGAVVTVVLLAYPIWFLLAGPRRVVGEPWPATPILGSHVDAIVTAGPGVRGPTLFTELGGYFGGNPSMAYLGLGILIFLVCSSVVWWRNRLAWVLVVTGFAAWLCSLGIALMPLAADSRQAWLPWQYLQHLPLLEDIVPNRFALIVDFAAAMLLAISIDAWLAVFRRLVTRLPAKPAAGRRAVRAAGIAGLAGALVVSVLPVVHTYVWPLTMHAEATPAWFQTTAKHLPAGTEVLTYPYASSAASEAMYWQAEDDLSFQLVGGRAETPGADGRHSAHVDPLRGTDALLTNDSFGFGIPAAPDRAGIEVVRASLQQWGVDVLVVIRAGRAPAFAVAMFTAALGRPPRLQHGSYVWYGVSGPGPRPLDVSAARIERCSGGGFDLRSFLAAPSCMLSVP
jgi:hypothetical protein